MATALSESASGLLATKDDITGIKLGLNEVKAEQKLMMWMLGLILAGIVALITKSFF
ncbi:MAG: hypothetical protein PHV02_07195 [Rhodocyclaceae bacterium]|nr:hypothetical protein [Rhodocyclaceae bacterium]